MSTPVSPGGSNGDPARGRALQENAPVVDGARARSYHHPMEQANPDRPRIAPAALPLEFVRAVRPRQWTKNLVVYLALLFTLNEAWEATDLAGAAWLAFDATVAFAVFCALSGAVYLANDVLDRKNDREHPVKRHRPIASGRLPAGAAWAGAFALALSSLAGAFALQPLFGVVSVVYLGAMAAYSLGLRRLILLDVFTISLGFVLRTVAGAVAIEVPVSPWLYICAGLGSLFIALAKRRGELAASGDDAANQRDTLGHYTLPLLDQLIGVVATSTIVAYSLYTFTATNLPENHAMMLTIPFVVYGLFRYLYLVHSRGLGERPEEVIVTDVPLLCAILLWLATTAAILGLLRA